MSNPKPVRKPGATPTKPKSGSSAIREDGFTPVKKDPPPAPPRPKNK